MSTQNDGGPAFPVTLFDGQTLGDGTANGMSLRAYAAIQLQAPDSGIDWLDAMIKEARRDSLAGMALQGILANPSAGSLPQRLGIPRCYELADAMLAEHAREKTP